MSGTPPEIKIGAAFSYRGTGPAHRAGTSHTCIVVTNPNSKKDVLLVPICSCHAGADQTCLIEISINWRPIRWKSYAAYYMMKKVYVPNLNKQMIAGDISYIGITPKILLEKVLLGISLSKDTEPQFLRAYKEETSPPPPIS